MTILEIEADDLSRLSSSDLEELVARLCEAELTDKGSKIRYVNRSGDINAPDGGVDVMVDTQGEAFEGEFIQRNVTIFQVKASKKFGPSKITQEMKKCSYLDELNNRNGAYIFVCAGFANSHPPYQNKIKCMKQVVGNRDVHVDFYDREHLNQWLRKYPSIALWVREKVNKPLIGWKGLNGWTNIHENDVGSDNLILEEGAKVILPHQTDERLSFSDALPKVREFLSTTEKKSTRVVGLSGVGKTRFVQALFEKHSDNTFFSEDEVIYADNGNELKPAPMTVLEEIITKNLGVVLVIDNCSSETHSDLTKRLSSQSNTPVRLITMDFDVSDDNPEATDVIRIEAEGLKVAEKLIQRRFPDINAINAERLAQISEGNARLALVLAEANGDNLDQLTDKELFNRLFYQRGQEDEQLKRQAEVLSLVYSFSVEKSKDGNHTIDELALLAELCGQRRADLYRTVNQLIKKGIAQQRGDDRAILPHPLANHLAKEALDNIPVDSIKNTFEKEGYRRLLLSFCKRLGYMHKNDVAKQIFYDWLDENGFLGKTLFSSDMANRYIFKEYNEPLELIAPVDPKFTLSILKKRGIINTSLLRNIAYEAELFDDAIAQLLAIALEGYDENQPQRRDFLTYFFQVHLSQTHASLEQKKKFIEKLLNSSHTKKIEIGFSCLEKALATRCSVKSVQIEFGSRVKDYGTVPQTRPDIWDWYTCFVHITKEIALNGDIEQRKRAKKLLSDNFRSLWGLRGIRDAMKKTFFEIHEQGPWIEGWLAIKHTLFDEKDELSDADIKDLKTLADTMRPKTLEDRINLWVISPPTHRQFFNKVIDEIDPNFVDGDEVIQRELLYKNAFDLGKECAEHENILEKLAPNLFDDEENSTFCIFWAFGKGLVTASQDVESLWNILFSTFIARKNKNNFSVNILVGIILFLSEQKNPLKDDFLDRCLKNEHLSKRIVDVHPCRNFDEQDFDRCLQAFDKHGINCVGMDRLIWSENYQAIPEQRKIALAKKMLKKNEIGLLLEALNMKIVVAENDKKSIHQDYIKLGWEAVCRSILDQERMGNNNSSRCKKILDYCFEKGNSDDDKNNFLDTIVYDLETQYHYTRNYGVALHILAKHMQDDFVSRIFMNSSIDRQTWLDLFINSHQTLLRDLEPQYIVNWCTQSQNDDSWLRFAQVINAFPENEQNPPCLSPQAKALLEAAPHPKAILDHFHLRPMGNASTYIERNIKAIEALLPHSDPKVHNAIKSFLPKEKERLAEERQKEQKSSRRRQSFDY